MCQTNIVISPSSSLPTTYLSRVAAYHTISSFPYYQVFYGALGTHAPNQYSYFTQLKPSHDIFITGHCRQNHWHHNKRMFTPVQTSHMVKHATGRSHIRLSDSSIHTHDINDQSFISTINNSIRTSIAAHEQAITH